MPGGPAATSPASTGTRPATSGVPPTTGADPTTTVAAVPTTALPVDTGELGVLDAALTPTGTVDVDQALALVAAGYRPIPGVVPAATPLIDGGPALRTLLASGDTLRDDQRTALGAIVAQPGVDLATAAASTSPRLAAAAAVVTSALATFAGSSAGSLAGRRAGHHAGAAVRQRRRHAQLLLARLARHRRPRARRRRQRVPHPRQRHERARPDARAGRPGVRRHARTGGVPLPAVRAGARHLGRAGVGRRGRRGVRRRSGRRAQRAVERRGGTDGSVSRSGRSTGARTTRSATSR